MKNYKKPSFVNSIQTNNIAINVVPGLAGAVGVVAGKMLAAAAVGAAATAGAKMFGDNRAHISLRPICEVEKTVVRDVFF